MTQKTNLRASFQLLRASISDSRRAEASLYVSEQIKKSSERLILSFDSFRLEINLSELNRWLSCEKRLVLPKIEGKTLALYQIEDLDHQLEVTPSGLREPISRLSRKIDPSLINLALIPGLAFDHDHFRLGYGKGHYDRLLVQQIPSIGIGFREQKSSAPLPRDPWDIPVQKLLLG